MKKLFLFLFLSVLSMVSFSQKALFYQTAKTFSYGPRFGFNTSTLFFENDAITQEQGIRLNFNGGVWGRYQLSTRWSVQANIDYSPRGSKQYKLDFIDVPVTVAYNVRYKMFKMPFTFDVYAGIQPSFLTKSTYEKNGVSVNNPRSINKTGLDVVFGSGFPMGRFLFYATNKINLTNLRSNGPQLADVRIGDLPSGILRGWSTEWFIAYRFGGSNSAQIFPQKGE